MFAHHHFNFTRFCYVLKHDCIEHWKDLFKVWGGLFLGFFFISLLCALPYLLHYAPSIGHDFNTFVTYISFFNAYIFVLVGASSIFSDLKTKQARINYYMLPATSAEKYVSRLVQCTLMVWIGVVVAFVAADLLNWVIRAIVREGGDLVLFHLFEPLDQFGFMDAPLVENTATQIIIQPQTLLIPIPFLTFLSAEATYILGGTLFRRYAFILTTVGVFVLSLLLVFAAGLTMGFLAEHYIDGNSSISSEAITHYIFWFGIANCVFHLLWTIACIWMSYRIFKRSNVIINRSIGL